MQSAVSSVHYAVFSGAVGTRVSKVLQYNFSLLFYGDLKVWKAVARQIGMLACGCVNRIGNVAKMVIKLELGGGVNLDVQDRTDRECIVYLEGS